jgi:hypothetical protein
MASPWPRRVLGSCGPQPVRKRFGFFAASRARRRRRLSRRVNTQESRATATMPTITLTAIHRESGSACPVPRTTLTDSP